MVDLTGLEPVTPSLPAMCSNQLSYRPKYTTNGLSRNRTGDLRNANAMFYQLNYEPTQKDYTQN